MQGATRDFAPIGERAHDLEPNRVAQRMEEVGEAHVLESWVIEVPHAVWFDDYRTFEDDSGEVLVVPADDQNRTGREVKDGVRDAAHH